MLNVFPCEGIAGVFGNLITGAGVLPLAPDFFRITFRIRTPTKIGKLAPDFYMNKVCQGFRNM